MEENNTQQVKYMMIYSGVFEAYYVLDKKRRKTERISDLLRKIGHFRHFSLTEIVNAKICCKKLIQKKVLLFSDTFEIFWTCCLLGKKFWNDDSLKNSEEIESVNGLKVRSINQLEREILKHLDYNFVSSPELIEKEISIEVNIDQTYKKAMHNHSVFLKTSQLNKLLNARTNK